MEKENLLGVAKRVGRAALFATLLSGAPSCAQQERPVSAPTLEKQPIESCFYPPSYLNDRLAPLISSEQDGGLIAISADSTTNAVLMGRIIGIMSVPSRESTLLAVSTGKRAVFVEIPQAKDIRFGLIPNINTWDQRNVTGWIRTGLGAEALNTLLFNNRNTPVNIIVPLEYSDQQLRFFSEAERERIKTTLLMNRVAYYQTILDYPTSEICSMQAAEVSIITRKITPPTLLTSTYSSTPLH